MEGAAGLDPVEQLDAADFDHAVAARRAEAGGLGVENDFAHGRFIAPLREPEASKDVADLARACRRAMPPVSITKSARVALVGVGHLAGEDRVEFGGGHARPRQHPLALDFGRGGDDDDRVERALAAGLEQQGDVEQQGRRARVGSR